jgi:hypothetical protein
VEFVQSTFLGTESKMSLGLPPIRIDRNRAAVKRKIYTGCPKAMYLSRRRRG